MRYKFVSSFVLMSLFALSAATGKITGRVIDAETGEPLPGANVVVEELGIGAATDLDGIYVILNVHPGTYTVKASMLSYQTVVKKSVRVRPDYTTFLDFKLKPQPIEAKPVVVTAKRPPVEADIVSTAQYTPAEVIRSLPALKVKDVLSQGAGIIPDLTFKGLTETQAQEQFHGNPSDGLHFRGGRVNETAYLFEGMYLNDPIWGGFVLDNIPVYALNEISAYTGTFGPQYGEALSAVVNFTLPELPSQKFSMKAMTDYKLPGSQNTLQTEFVLGNSFFNKKLTLFLAGKFYTTDGRFYGYIYPNWRDSEGTDTSGTPQKVPMNYRDLWSFIGKITYRFTPSIKLSTTFLWDTVQTMEYLHFYKYAPNDAPRFWMQDFAGVLNFTHLVNPNTFYRLGIGYYEKHYKGSVYEDLDDNLVERHIISPGGFAVSGVAYLWKRSISKTKSLSFRITHQSGIHEILLGGEFYKYYIHLERRNPTAADPTDSVPPYEMAPWELYTREPSRAAFYFKDKIEFRDIGFILNGGFRIDWVNPNTYWVKDYKHLATSEYYKVKPKTYVSPRLGVSYPVAENMAFRFSYGVFHQFPAFYLLYQGLNEHSDVYPRPTFRDIQTAVGNAEMKPERVTSYEVGLQYAITPNLTLNAAAFYRDLADLIGRRFISGEDVPVEYYMFDNKGYGTIKGIDITLNQRFTGRTSATINYTYTQVRISHPDVLFFPQVKFYRPVVADWEIPHKLSFSVTYSVPDDWSVTFSGFYSSGLPYTIGIEPNTERGPSLKQVDMRAEKFLKFKGISGSVFLQVFNLFDFENIYWVYPATGRAGDDGNPATPPDWDKNPTQYGPGRRFFVGFSLNM